MKASDYQSKAARTLRDELGFEIGLRNWVIILNGVALASAAGKVVERIKKGIFHQHGLADADVLAGLRKVRTATYNFFGRENSFAWWQITARETMIVWSVVGLLGEAAEVAELILDGIGRKEIDRQALVKELGNCLWYIAGIATKYGLDLGEVMEQNITKLEQRYPDGFKVEDSLARVDVSL